MSARIAPRADTMGIGFSPHLPRFMRPPERKPQGKRSDAQPTPADTRHQQGDPAGVDAGTTAEMLFEISLLANQQGGGHFSPEEAARRLREDWAPPASSFPLTDKII